MRIPKGIDPTSYSDELAWELRKYYEQNRESWWDRRSEIGRLRRRGVIADDLMLGLLGVIAKFENKFCKD